MRIIIPTLLLLSAISLFGCAHVVSKELREASDDSVSIKALMKDPEAFKGKIVILGGDIVSSANKDEGTYIEVVQKELTPGGRPKNTDISFGRFLILYEGYLDTAVYSRGRTVTVAGEVLGKQIRTLGEIRYSYPLIKSREIHIFEPRYSSPVRFGIGIWQTF